MVVKRSPASWSQEEWRQAARRVAFVWVTTLPKATIQASIAPKIAKALSLAGYTTAAAFVAPAAAVAILYVATAGSILTFTVGISMARQLQEECTDGTLLALLSKPSVAFAEEATVDIGYPNSIGPDAAAIPATAATTTFATTLRIPLVWAHDTLVAVFAVLSLGRQPPRGHVAESAVCTSNASSSEHTSFQAMDAGKGVPVLATDSLTCSAQPLEPLSPESGWANRRQAFATDAKVSSTSEMEPLLRQKAISRASISGGGKSVRSRAETLT
jgi:hypothetical protein